MVTFRTSKFIKACSRTQISESGSEDMQPSRRKRPLKQFATLFGTSVLFGNLPASTAQQTSEPSIEQYLDDPLLQPVHVRDFEPLAKAKLDPLAYDYLVGGSEDEVSLRDNRSGFDRIIIRPKALVDVHSMIFPSKSSGRSGSIPSSSALLEARIASIRMERTP